MISFKERVKNECIKYAKDYEKNFIRYEYLICSRAFNKGYHIVKSDKGNYLHLTGVHTNLSAEQFFDRCYNEELEETEFDFVKPHKSEESVKGAVRDKIKAFPDMVNLFNKKLLAEDDFKKNRVECAFATSDNKCTLGFVKEGRPQSLLRGNELNSSKMQEVDLIFRKTRSSKCLFQELIYGDIVKINDYKDEIVQLIDEEFFNDKKGFTKRNKYMLSVLQLCREYGRWRISSKIPICFRRNTYSEKLKQIKLRNKLR